jgi:hypothetical protein
MEEQYKGHVIRVTTEKDKGAYPWKPICRIMYQRSRELIKQLDWDIGYDTPNIPNTAVAISQPGSRSICRCFHP